jgi:membrane protease YdiL (CAAX protease family)
MPVRHIASRSSIVETPAIRTRRRRVVAGVVLAGTGLLAASLSTRPGSKQFYVTSTALAATWTAGGLASGPLHRGWIEGRDRKLRRPLVTPAATGTAAFGLFYAAAHFSQRVPVLARAVARALAFAEDGNDALVLATALANGVGEEIFFRGALYAALGGKHPGATSTAVYVLATTSTRNPALVIAAGIMGTLFAMQRRASGGIQAPTITHLVWSALMIRCLPGRPAAPASGAGARRAWPLEDEETC